jgi:hypothetical protein
MVQEKNIHLRELPLSLISIPSWEYQCLLRQLSMFNRPIDLQASNPATHRTMARVLRAVRTPMNFKTMNLITQMFSESLMIMAPLKVAAAPLSLESEGIHQLPITLPLRSNELKKKQKTRTISKNLTLPRMRISLRLLLNQPKTEKAPRRVCPQN